MCMRSHTFANAILQDCTNERTLNAKPQKTPLNRMYAFNAPTCVLFGAFGAKIVTIFFFFFFF